VAVDVGVDVTVRVGVEEVGYCVAVFIALALGLLITTAVLVVVTMGLIGSALGPR